MIWGGGLTLGKFLIFIIRPIISFQLKKKKREYLNIGNLNSALINRENTIMPLNVPDGLISNYFHHTQQSASLLPNGTCHCNENCNLMGKKEKLTCGSTNNGDKRKKNNRLDI